MPKTSCHPSIWHQEFQGKDFKLLFYVDTRKMCQYTTYSILLPQILANRGLCISSVILIWGFSCMLVTLEAAEQYLYTNNRRIVNKWLDVTWQAALIVTNRKLSSDTEVPFSSQRFLDSLKSLFWFYHPQHYCSGLLSQLINLFSNINKSWWQATIGIFPPGAREGQK